MSCFILWVVSFWLAFSFTVFSLSCLISAVSSSHCVSSHPWSSLCIQSCVTLVVFRVSVFLRLCALFFFFLSRAAAFYPIWMFNFLSFPPVSSEPGCLSCENSSKKIRINWIWLKAITRKMENVRIVQEVNRRTKRKKTFKHYIEKNIKWVSEREITSEHLISYQQ